MPCLTQGSSGRRGAPLLIDDVLTEDCHRSRSHGLNTAVLMAQADALGVPLLTAGANWPDYEPVFAESLRKLRGQGIAAGVFGDIDIPGHLEWVQRMCAAAGMKAWLPLWQQDRLDLVHECIELGYRALVVSARDDLADLLGREMDRALLTELEARQVDPCGEQGEFHTVVVDGPAFRQPVAVIPGRTIKREGYAFLDYSLSDSE